MRTARTADRRWTIPLAVVLLALAAAVTIVLLAGQAWAAEGSNNGPAATTAEVCAPGAMTITKDGPTVYDGVDCELGPHALGAATPEVPSATVLPPMDPPSAPTPPSS